MKTITAKTKNNNKNYNNKNIRKESKEKEMSSEKKSFYRAVLKQIYRKIASHCLRMETKVQLQVVQ